MSHQSCNPRWKVNTQKSSIQIVFLIPSTDGLAFTPPVRHAQLAAAYLRTAPTHQDVIRHAVSCIQHQHQALRISSRTLDLNILQSEDNFEGLAPKARNELDRQAELLSSVESDLEAVGRMNVHPEFMSATVRKAIEAGGKVRTIGDYVSNAKMRQVAEGCSVAHSKAPCFPVYCVDIIDCRFFHRQYNTSVRAGG